MTTLMSGIVVLDVFTNEACKAFEDAARFTPRPMREALR
jgi:hypothetical protein